MPRDLFACPPDHPESRRNTRLLPFSIVLHAVLIGGVVIVPLLATADLPKVAALRSPALIVKTVPPPDVVPPPVRHSGPPRAGQAPSPVPPSIATPPTPFSTTFGDVLEDTPLPFGLPTAPTGSVDGLIGGGPAHGPGTSAAPSGPLRAGGDIERPRKIRHVPPEYPPIAQQARREGTVVIDAIIGPDGRVTQTTVRQSVALLDEAALAAVRQWVYTPTKLNGTPVAVIMTVEVRFQLR